MFAGRRVPVGEGVDNFTSNLDMTLSRSKGTRPAPLNPALTFLSIKTFKNAAWNATRNSALVIWLMTDFMNPSIS